MTDVEKAKAAKAQYMKDYKTKNKDKLATYRKKYMKSWRANNPDKIRLYNERYFLKLYDKQNNNDTCGCAE